MIGTMKAIEAFSHEESISLHLAYCLYLEDIFPKESKAEIASRAQRAVDVHATKLARLRIEVSYYS